MELADGAFRAHPADDPEPRRRQPLLPLLAQAQRHERSQRMCLIHASLEVKVTSRFLYSRL